VIIGVLRSGTTSLARYLGAHPDAFVPPEKELHFFDSNFDRGDRWYRSFFADAGDASAVGEATPNYFFSSLALQRMASVIPDARLIAILRQPVDRAYSHYWMNRERGRERRSFVQAIDEEPSVVRSALSKGDIPKRVYLERSRYADRLATISEIYPRDSLLVVLTDDLVADPEHTFARACGHLGIDPSERPDRLGEPLNQYVRIRSTRVRDAGRKITHPIGRVIRRLNVRKRPYPPLDPELRRRLTRQMEDEIVAVERWLDRDLDVWRT
jgi:hypothetical protein